MNNSKEIKIAVYAGSFDPITLGHLDILKYGAEIFDKVIIAVANNPDKGGNKSLLSVDERIELIKECTKNIPNIEVDSFSGLTVEYAKAHNANILLRGIRSVQDFEYEKELAQNNSALAPEIKTVFLITKPEHSFISSSAVREIISNRGDISNFVPSEVASKLKR